MREPLQTHDARHLRPSLVAACGEAPDDDRVARERQTPVHILVTHVDRGDLGRGVPDFQAPFEAGCVPGPGDADIGREDARHVPQRRRERLQDGKIHAVRGSPHREPVGELPLPDGGEREIERQLRLHVQDPLLARAPQLDGPAEAPIVVLERTVEQRGVELAHRRVGERERAVRQDRGGARTGQVHGGLDRAAHARRVPLQQRVDPRQGESIDPEVGRRPAAGGQVPLEPELAGDVIAVQHQVAHRGYRIRDPHLCRRPQPPDVPGDLQLERIQAQRQHRVAPRARPALEPTPSAERARFTQPSAGKPGERVRRPLHGNRVRREPQAAVRQGVEPRVELQRGLGAGRVG